jgi:hypothetical protein
MSTTKLSISVTPGKENRYFDLRVNRNSFINDDGTPVRPEVLYESIRHALLGAELGLEMIMIRVGKYPAYRSQPHFAFHVPAQKRIYYDPLQAFRSSVTEINNRGSLRLWSFRSEAAFWEVKPKQIVTDDVLSEDNLPEEVLHRETVSAAPSEADLANNPVHEMDLAAFNASEGGASLLGQLNEPQTVAEAPATFMGHAVVEVSQDEIDQFMSEEIAPEHLEEGSVSDGLLSPTEEEDAELLLLRRNLDILLPEIFSFLLLVH